MKTIAAVLLMLVTASAANAQRQWYSSWYEQPNEYHFRFFNYRVNANDAKPVAHIVIWLPEKSRRWVYWYDPTAKVFWARCEPGYRGVWQVLDPKKRTNNFKDIKEEDWSQSIPAPMIPGCADGKKIDWMPVDAPKWTPLRDVKKDKP